MILKTTRLCSALAFLSLGLGACAVDAVDAENIDSAEQHLYRTGTPFPGRSVPVC